MRIEKIGNDYNLFFRGKGTQFSKEGSSPLKVNLLEGELSNGIFLWSTNLEGEDIKSQRVVVSKELGLNDYNFYFDTDNTLRIELGDPLVKYLESQKRVSFPLLGGGNLNISYGTNNNLYNKTKL